MRFATLALRVGQEPDSDFKAVVPPLYQSTTFAWDSLEDIPSIDYTRCQNPNRLMLEKVIAALEGGSHCTVYASGMAAIAASFSLLRQGDHILMATDIYGGTHRMVEQYLPRQGVTHGFFDSMNPDSIHQAVRPETKMLIFETPSNPNLKVCDIEAVVSAAKKHGLIVVFDNTFASPALQNPLALGVDIVVHSTTKYISGHSDVLGGATITNDPEIGHALYEWTKAYGATPSPFDCWLSLRGLRTLSVRMERHCKNAQAVAEAMEGHPAVRKVHYPGLRTHPQHETAKKQMKGFGGMLAVEFVSEAIAREVAQTTEIFLLAESLGGVESLIAFPPLMSHATMTEDQRLERGIPPSLLRISCGIEDPEDLIEDLKQAISRAEAKLAVVSNA
ncbi:MAG: PLP-dependent aspartate aminotransferase family protein [Fimbriimonadaceae bacterium]|jgi:cystathionine beta-lyase/cystathionine gamma-synthase|nr:PLP-dependent aspartate aminotransferase family protein [Fimbriimonadaceae bacterium]